MHTLRYLFGDEVLKESLSRMAYPGPEMEKITDGSHTRFASTNDYKQIIEDLSGQELDWFFDIYLHQPLLPVLNAEIEDQQLTLKWTTPGNISFPMPVDLKLGEQLKRVMIPEKGVTITLEAGVTPEIDPKNWILFNPAGLKEAGDAIKNGDLKKAKALYKKVLIVDPQNKNAKKMIKHLDYASGNSDKINSAFFDKFIGKYTDSRRSREIVKEGSIMYLFSRGSKFRLFPISDSEFTIMDFDVTFSLVINHDGTAKELVIKTGDSSQRAVSVK